MSGRFTPHLIAAFGESKSIKAWSRDARCAVNYAALVHRLRCGWQAETAITQPIDASRQRFWARKPVRLWGAFGELKSVNGWSRDPRCKVEYSVLLKRVKKGIPIEVAMRARSMRDIASPHFSAFGEEKSLSDWLRDSRCMVSRALLQRRLADGWAFEDALVQGTRPKHYRKPLIEAFGERKTLAAWATDPRCRYTAVGITIRMKAGMSPEDAIAGPRRPLGIHKRSAHWQDMHRAFGEEKTLEVWVDDPRFEVAVATFLRRIAAGDPPEVGMRKSGRIASSKSTS